MGRTSASHGSIDAHSVPAIHQRDLGKRAGARQPYSGRKEGAPGVIVVNEVMAGQGEHMTITASDSASLAGEA